MENGWNLFNFNTTSTSTPTPTPTFGNKGQNSNNTPSAWDVWESGSVPPETTSSRIHWGSNSNNFINPHSNSSANEESAAADFQTLMGNYDHARFYGGGGGGGGGVPHYFPDPHLMCLKLGKRNYFGVGDRQAASAAAVAYNSITKKGKPYYDVGGSGGGGGDGGISVNERNSTSATGVTVASLPAAVPRCQVDGCNVALVNAKDYHKRHKVCEMHSKAPKVVVLGVEQRFCQQCSRFHAVSEFDESKRSCRRRLAGHNERRRKSSQQLEHSAISRNHSQSHVDSKLMTNYPGRNPYIPPLNSGCALSLLSSKSDHNSSLISSTDLPTRCSAALRELIAENRASILSRQLIFEHWNDQQPAEDHLNGRQIMNNNNYQQQISSGSNNWDRIGEADGDGDGDGHVTLDLMQAPNSAFGLLSMRGKTKEDDQECPELWSSFGGAHVV